MYRLEGVHLLPLGFIRLPVKALKIRWRDCDTELSPILILFMERSYVLEVCELIPQGIPVILRFVHDVDFDPDSRRARKRFI